MLLTYWTETQYMIYREVSWLRLLLRRKLEGIYPQICSIACNASATESAFQGQKNIQLDNDSITRAFNCLAFVEGFIRCIPISPCLVIISFTYFYLGWGDQGVPGPSIFGLMKPSVFLTKSQSRFVSVVLHSVLLPPHLTVSLYICRSRSNIQGWVEALHMA